jgi:hypothetical protein
MRQAVSSHRSGSSSQLSGCGRLSASSTSTCGGRKACQAPPETPPVPPQPHPTQQQAAQSPLAPPPHGCLSRCEPPSKALHGCLSLSGGPCEQRHGCLSSSRHITVGPVAGTAPSSSPTSPISGTRQPDAARCGVFAGCAARQEAAHASTLGAFVVTPGSQSSVCHVGGRESAGGQAVWPHFPRVFCCNRAMTVIAGEIGEYLPARLILPGINPGQERGQRPARKTSTRGGWR